MEIALERAVPTYAGGLGVLAGDTVSAAADLCVPFVAVSLLHRLGFFRQHLDAEGQQHEAPEDWSPEDRLTELPVRVHLQLEGRQVAVRAWRYLVHGGSGGTADVLLLDTGLEENHPDDQTLTDHLYAGDLRHRLRQEAVLGIAGIAMLRALGYTDVLAYHMNEGHSALLSYALLAEQLYGRPLSEATDDDVASVRRRCVFTTHTPVPEGHDQFPLDMVRGVLGDEAADALERTGACPDGTLNMTRLALVFSRYVNGVAVRHGEISRGMFPGYPIASITNGVHAERWTAPPFQALFDRHIPTWRRQNSSLRNASAIPAAEVRQAHEEAKRALLEMVRDRNGRMLNPHAFTVGFARRATGYKRTDLLFSDLDRLRRLTESCGPLQLIFAGKAHPNDGLGKGMIRRVFEAAEVLGESLPVVYLENYDVSIARLLCSGVDLWLNTPQRPHEASGTSGMKAALNGVPSLSVLDGWWLEGHHEGVTGWSIGDPADLHADGSRDAASMYDKFEHVILPTYYGRPNAYDQVMRAAISLNGSFFNAERMLQQYVVSAYHG